MVHNAPTKGRIPTFETIEDEAAFWDSHDSTEFEDEFERVELAVARPLMHGLSIEFEGEAFHRLVAAAKRRGIGPVKLSQMWVLDALERDEAAQS